MPSVDKRVVEMKFDNAAFERGIAQTMDSIDKFKNKMNFDGAVKGLSSLTSAGSKFDMGGMASSIDTISAKFSALQVAGVTALATIVNKAVNSGIQLTKALSIGPVGQGYADYNTKLTSVQTIMNSTGADIQEVGKYFNQLDTYADKTIYNLTDMTSAFAKFTNAGIDMKTAVPMIKGIANMTAVAGQDAGAAQIAYYNLSQSLSGGFLTTIDYKSLNLANIATKEWRTNMINAAVAAGTLKKGANGSYQAIDANGKASKKSYTFASLFTEGLSEQWATTKVLTKVLGDYGDTTTAIGRKAQAAAQNVKSLPMLMTTVKEAIGTSWTSSFEFILGNVTQSTKMFTDASNALGKIIGDMGQARNHMLHAWQSEGGRTAIIGSISNVWKAFGAILKPIGKAFREIFPKDSSVSKLAQLSFIIRNFTAHLILGKENGERLQRVFKGVFSIFKIGIAIVKGLSKGLFSVFGVVASGATEGASSLLELVAKLGDFITGIQKWLSKTHAIETFFAVLTSPLKMLRPGIDILVKVGKALASLMSGDISGFKKNLGGVVAGFKGMFADVLKRYHDFAQTLSDGFAKIEQFLTGWAKKAKDSGNKVGAALATVGAKIAGFLSQFSGNASAGLGHFITSLTGATVEGKNFLSGFGSGLIGNVMSIVDKLSGTFQNLRDKMNFDPVLASFDSGMGHASSGASGGMHVLTVALQALGDVWSGIIGMFKGIGKGLEPIFTSIRDFFTAVMDRITSAIKGMNGNTAIEAFNTGVLVALYLIIRRFSLDVKGLFKDIRQVFKNIGGVFSQLTNNLKTMQQNVKANIILKIAGAVAMLTASLYILSKMDPKALATSLGAVTALFAELATTMVVITKYGMGPSSAKIAATGAAMLLLSGAIVTLSVAVKILGSMKPLELAQGLGAVGIILGSLAFFTKYAALDKGGFKAGVGLVLMATAITILTVAVEALGRMKAGDLIKAALAIDFLLGSLVAAAIGMEGTLKGSAAMMVMASALAILTPVLVTLGLMPYENLGKGLVTVALGLTFLAVAANAMDGALPGAVAMVAVAKAILILTPALMLMGKMSLGSIAKGLVTLALALTILVIATNAMDAALPGAAALLIVAGAIDLLVPALILLGNLKWSTLLKGVAGLALVLAVLIAAVYALTPVIGIMILATKAIALLGAAVLLAGLGFLAFSAGLTALAATGAAGFAVLVAGVVSFLAILPVIAKQIGFAFLTFAQVIGDNAPKLIEAFTKIVMAWLKSLQTTIPEFIKTMVIIIESMIAAAVKLYPEFVAAGLDMIIGFLEALRSRIGEITNLVIDIFVAFVSAVKKRLPNIIQAGIDFLISFMNGLAEGIRSRSDEINKAGINIATAIIDGIGKGLSKAGHLAREALESLGRNMLDAFKRFFGINSPSTVFEKMGGYLIDGLVNGFSNGYQLVKDAVVGLGKKLPGWMQKVLGINSPSKVFHELGGYVGQGFANGIDSTSRLVAAATRGISADALSGMKSAIANVGSGVSSSMDTSPTIRPVLDLSHVEKNAGKIGSLLSTNPISADVAYLNATDISSKQMSNGAAASLQTAQMQKALAALASVKAKESDAPRPVQFNIETVQDGDSLLRRARATNKMLTLAEGGDSTQVMGVLV